MVRCTAGWEGELAGGWQVMGVDREGGALCRGLEGWDGSMSGKGQAGSALWVGLQQNSFGAPQSLQTI